MGETAYSRLTLFAKYSVYLIGYCAPHGVWAPTRLINIYPGQNNQSSRRLGPRRNLCDIVE